MTAGSAGIPVVGAIAMTLLSGCGQSANQPQTSRLLEAGLTTAQLKSPDYPALQRAFQCHGVVTAVWNDHLYNGIGAEVPGLEQLDENTIIAWEERMVELADAMQLTDLQRVTLERSFTFDLEAEGARPLAVQAAKVCLDAPTPPELLRNEAAE